MEIGILYSTFIFALIVVVTLFKGVKIVPQGSKWVIQRLGKFHSTLNPGLNFIIPYFDRVAYRVTTKLDVDKIVGQGFTTIEAMA